MYQFKSFNLEPDSTLELDTSRGAIVVRVEGLLEFGDRMHFIGGSRTSAYFYSNTTGTLRFGTDIDFTGSVTAPSGSIHVYSRTNLTANLWAKFITFEPQVRLRR